jgi:hypothetical protein
MSDQNSQSVALSCKCQICKKDDPRPADKVYEVSYSQAQGVKPWEEAMAAVGVKPGGYACAECLKPFLGRGNKPKAAIFKSFKQITEDKLSKGTPSPNTCIECGTSSRIVGKIAAGLGKLSGAGVCAKHLADVERLVPVDTNRGVLMAQCKGVAQNLTPMSGSAKKCVLCSNHAEAHLETADNLPKWARHLAGMQLCNTHVQAFQDSGLKVEECVVPFARDQFLADCKSKNVAKNLQPAEGRKPKCALHPQTDAVAHLDKKKYQVPDSLHPYLGMHLCAECVAVLSKAGADVDAITYGNKSDADILRFFEARVPSYNALPESERKNSCGLCQAGVAGEQVWVAGAKWGVHAGKKACKRCQQHKLKGFGASSGHMDSFDQMGEEETKESRNFARVKFQGAMEKFQQRATSKKEELATLGTTTTLSKVTIGGPKKDKEEMSDEDLDIFGT